MQETMQERSSEKEGLFADLIVVGSGPAGLAAFAAASDQGLQNVLCLEREKLPGGRLRRKNEEEAGREIFHRAIGSAACLKHFLSLLGNYELSVSCGCELRETKFSKADREHLFSLLVRQDEGKEKHFFCRALILATGEASSPEGSTLLPFPGESPDASSLPAGLFLAGEFRRKCPLPDDAARDGAEAGRRASDYLLSNQPKSR